MVVCSCVAQVDKEKEVLVRQGGGTRRFLDRVRLLVRVR